MMRLPVEILSMIVGELDLGSLQLFQATCRSFRRSGSFVVRKRMEDSLRKFQIDAPSFLQLLKEYRAVVVGDIPLSIVFPNSFNPQSVTVVVPGESISDFAHLLSTQFGWVLTPGNPDGLWIFTKEGARMHLSKGRQTSAIALIGNAPTTDKMMFLSSTGIYMAYPALTLRKRSLTQSTRALPWVHSGVHLRNMPWLDYKPALTSWLDYQNHICGSSWSCPRTLRRMHDGGGLFWAFNEDGEDKDCIYDGLRSVVWKLYCALECRTLGTRAHGFSRHVALAKVR